MEEVDYVSGNVPGTPSVMTADELRELLMEVLNAEPASEEDLPLLEEEELEVSPVDVSGNSVSSNTVSSNDYTPLLTDMYTEVLTLQKEELPIWEKPLKDYSVAEGLLLLMFLLLLGIFFSHFLKGGEKYV